jgi:hypothetical protein
MARFRPRLKFSLRTLLVGVTLLCLPCFWVGYQLNWIRERNAARRWLEANGQSYIRARDAVDSVMPEPAPSGLDLFGEEGVASILLFPTTEHPFDRQEKKTELSRLFPEASYFEEVKEGDRSD